MTPLINSQIILPDTSLCAIVRDEIMNPAGGIVDFVDSTLPYVEAGVIVDTGSKDGTREALEDLKQKYSHLEVYDTKFQGFAHARNNSLKHCKTKRALVLDADERFTREDFKKIHEELNLNPSGAYRFEFVVVEGNDTIPCLGGLNPRLFEIKGVKFSDKVWERIINHPYNTDIEVGIKHFVPNLSILHKKRKEFYKQLLDEVKQVKPLRDFPFFNELRKYNPKREEYR